ncbi:MAG: ketoacyl-ACP synthase III [Phycisphaeraceae bacterium]|nr:ketoacyl-ACP synthase III [Phycisphaeraceae bacterium]
MDAASTAAAGVRGKAGGSGAFHTLPGVRIAGTGMALPSRVLTNADLEKMMDTSDEWIVQRTGIRQRFLIDETKGECTRTLSTTALRNACADAKVDPASLDLLIVATMTPEMSCPPSACRIAAEAGAVNAGAWDLSGACSGFVFGLNVVSALVRSGAYRTIGLVGADTLSIYQDYSTAGRGTSIIFGDAAGAVVITADADRRLGVLAQSMHSDGRGWKDIYVPEKDRDFPEGVEPDPRKIKRVQMSGATVFKFAVGTFPEVIEQTLDKAGLKASDVDMFVCHQSNARILQAARDRFGLSTDKLYINIERFGNTVGASVPLCLHELRAAGRVKPGMKVMFVAFGGGLTWGSSLWQM